MYISLFYLVSFLKLFVTPLLNGMKSQLPPINNVMRFDAPSHSL